MRDGEARPATAGSRRLRRAGGGEPYARRPGGGEPTGGGCIAGAEGAQRGPWSRPRVLRRRWGWCVDWKRLLPPASRVYSRAIEADGIGVMLSCAIGNKEATQWQT